MANRVLTTLGRIPRSVTFLLTTAVVLLSLTIGGWFGGLVLLAMSAGLLLVLSRVWLHVGVTGRAVRLLMVTMVMAMAIIQFRR